MTKQWRRCSCITLLMLLLQVAWLQPLRAATDDTKPVWQTTDADGDNYLSNRRALVGSGCMVNRLGADGVNVVPVVTNLENLCDEDLTNTTTLVGAVSATVAAGPLISVKDVKNYYAAGTKAGFVVTASESKLLGLDLGKAFSIMFYKDGTLQETVAVESGQTASALGLSLVQVGGSESCKEYVATSTKEFDEIRLTQLGVLDLSVATDIGFKYAFVGAANEYTLTSNTENGIAKYAEDYGRGEFTLLNRLAHWDSDYTSSLYGDLTDDNLSNGVSAVLLAAASADVVAKPSDNKEAFCAGTQVGFDYSSGSVISAGETITITLYDRNYNKVESHVVQGSLLDALSYSSGKVSVVAENDFSEAYIAIPKISVGYTTIHYAFVSMPPSIEKHHCDLNVSASLNVCDCDDTYQLSASKDVSWTVTSQPSGASATVNGSGLVSGLSVAGKYVFTATASDGCSENDTINYGTGDSFASSESTIDRLTGTGYTVSSGSNEGVSLTSSLTNPNAITSTSLRDYAYYKGGVSLAGKSHIVSVKKASGTWNYTVDKYAGFVVTAKSTALKADLLDFLGINLYLNGEKVDVTLTADNGVLTADLGSSDNVQQRVNYVVKVPAGTEFDEIALVKAGTLGVDLSQLNIYYAYISDNSLNPETTGTVVSYNNTGASLDAANTSFVAVANVANTAFNLTYLVDDDLSTGVTFPAVSVANATKIGVKLGKTINHEKQNLLIVTSDASAVLEASLIDVMKVELYQNGVQVGTNESGGTGFGVLSANVLGYKNNHSYINVSSTVDFDEVVLTRGSGATVAEDYVVYGILLRNDYNADGVPDESDPEPCAQELVLDEDVSLNKTKSYTKARLIFHRTFNGDVWNSVILPVNLTKAQFLEAFGSDAKLSAVSELTTETETSGTTTTTTNTLVFKTVNDETDGVFMAKNTPYIINVSSTTLEKHPTDATYESIDDGEVTGSLFFVDNSISYDKSDNYETTHSANADADAFTLTGSYNAEQTLATGSYVFSKGNLYHTIKDHTQKAYRCWITYTGTDASTQLKGFSVDDATTGIHSVINETATGNNALYNLMGQRVNAPTLPGLYIMGGKKVLVK